MTTQYNVVTYGNLTNTNGVLSGFSSDNYATIPLNFNPTQRPYEVVFKFVGTNGVIWNVGDLTTARGHIDFEVYQNKLYAEFAANTTLIWSIEGVTTILANTDYWVKLTYNGVDTYSLYLSTNGTTWNTEGTATSSDFLGDGSTEYNLIGVQTSGGVIHSAFNGSIDLNGSYINIDNIRWWQGATTISNVRTKVQLRHDTAANWTSINPVLLEGEVGIETDTRKQKFGDGTTAWNSLPYDKGSTALQSITSSNVTNALGYTPVNKAGDTMTGGLRIDTAISDEGIILKNTSDNTSSVPATVQLRSFRATNNDDTILGDVRFIHNTNGSTSASLLSRNYLTGSLVQASIEVRVSASGVASCTFPNTTCCDGQWASNSGQLASNVSLAVGSDQRLEYDISSYLPNDNYNYEVRFSIDAQTGSGSGAGLKISLIGKAYNNVDTWVRVCDMFARGSWAMVMGNSAIVPIGTDRKVKLNYSVISKAAQLNDLYIEGYRRIGTNG